MLGFFKRRRRARLRAQPFPADRLAIVERNVPFWRHLPADDRAELLGLVQVFLAEKNFEGCGGLELTDEMRVTIAANACLLLLRRETDVYPRLQSVLVYPTTFVARVVEEDEDGLVSELDDSLDGEAWDTGAVILAWDEVLHDARHGRDGRHVVLHEFAHQLDQETGEADGTPRLTSGHAEWARVFGEAYQKLQNDADKRRPTVLDTYGAEDPSEFFAVATESFFEDPVALRRRHAELYAQLQGLYVLDTAGLVEGSAASAAGRPRA
jgi:MtfA peptidase